MSKNNNPVCTFKLTGEFGEFAKVQTDTETLLTFALYEVDNDNSDVCLVAYNETLNDVPLVIFRNYKGDIKDLQRRCMVNIRKACSKDLDVEDYYEEF